ncbi:hypothetical protein GIB67_029862 [Kingdonia uniflora]|uniref:Uncharacterized protein n=1 Tax=Kingdonia uniflora TaxID=39325 RepID=A0A7J7NJS6_9MAGN|nr:hypothetical protein GIB67_029862 [Kingdonia uniflora]
MVIVAKRYFGKTAVYKVKTVAAEKNVADEKYSTRNVRRVESSLKKMAQLVLRKAILFAVLIWRKPMMHNFIEIMVKSCSIRDWWHWVSDGDTSIVAKQGMVAEAYKALDPGTPNIFLKALCDIRIEQEDIRNYIDVSIKQGIQLSVFRKERIGGDSHGVHTVATNLDEFEEVFEKLVSSKSSVESSVGKKLKIDMIPESKGLLKQTSPEPTVRREVDPKHEASTNGRSNGRLHTPQQVSYESQSPKSGDSEEYESLPLDSGNRRGQRPRRYS